MKHATVPVTNNSAQATPLAVRRAVLRDVAMLVELESLCFQTDRLTARRFKHYVRSEQAELFVVEASTGCTMASSSDTVKLVGYGLLLARRGTQLTRLYSIAVSPHERGKGIAGQLIARLEEAALTRGKPFMRLEVSSRNEGAIALYKRLGFVTFGLYENYYGDHSDAVRMQKRLLSGKAVRHAVYPWYQQTTEFTCGPAALMMAMHHLAKGVVMSQQKELDIWRQATTIYMTSGHGGSHPIGLGLAAIQDGFNAKVLLNRSLPLFVDGVRSAHKKQLIAQVEDMFYAQSQEKGMPVIIADWQLTALEDALQKGDAVLCLISTYALDKKKAPHWVTITGCDKHCFYLHDPDAEGGNSLEFQHIPIARDDFLRLASYGKRKIRALVILSQSNTLAQTLPHSS